MIQNPRTLSIGIFIFILPFLGFPSFWKTLFIILCGFALITSSLKISIPKKATKRPRRKDKVTPVFVENSPVFPRRPEVVRSEADTLGEF